jgi:hypothetical protein
MRRGGRASPCRGRARPGSSVPRAPSPCSSHLCSFPRVAWVLLQEVAPQRSHVQRAELVQPRPKGIQHRPGFPRAGVCSRRAGHSWCAVCGVSCRPWAQRPPRAGFAWGRGRVPNRVRRRKLRAGRVRPALLQQAARPAGAVAPGGVSARAVVAAAALLEGRVCVRRCRTPNVSPPSLPGAAWDYAPRVINRLLQSLRHLGHRRRELLRQGEGFSNANQTVTGRFSRPRVTGSSPDTERHQTKRIWGVGPPQGGVRASRMLWKAGRGGSKARAPPRQRELTGRSAQRGDGALAGCARARRGRRPRRGGGGMRPGGARTAKTEAGG